MRNFATRFAVLAACLLLLPFSSPVLAQDDDASDAPGGFADVMNATRGVVVRVPVNARGDENTDAAEMRFLQRDVAVSTTSSPAELWRAAEPVDDSPEVTGRNIPAGHDSATWGWYNWYHIGWVSPYFYTYYYPRFYYSNYWWSYRYYWNWNYFGYRYYYYTWWY